ncbi:CPBP family intramembrane metalloprotease [Rhodocaloribacter litoris]|uniref:CPBP family intramembrane glutamic endopeptidase n=1 Tax=Rhodocaloribacter litoris TaxID=2558931 RepID=UPI00141DC81D|nr:CPBP family intramembrane glutamic endopeptidase [Rhodocaloribacter litoris]QXD14612.1 CPBP family intramembrane metalloprotease [Rhodocaloribacter litoris]GIV59616.1 MAG: abortive infection protein [Rhodothermaceae bacterium]
MKARLRSEWQRLVNAARTVDRQTAFVLAAAALFVILQMQFGSRRLFRSELAPLFPEAWRELLAWGWWFAAQGVFGFVLPVLCLRVLFRRRPHEIGLGAGDVRLALTLALLYLPLVLLGTWVLSDGAAFQAKYPHYQPAALDWRVFFVYEALFLFYWIGWEYLWRGFVLFGTAHTLGYYAIFVQAMPFAILHYNKPLPEALLSILGGVVLGALVWRCRSFWIAVPIHAFQMLALDFWCTLRIRTGVSGVAPGALIELLGAWLGR